MLKNMEGNKHQEEGEHQEMEEHQEREEHQEEKNKEEKQEQNQEKNEEEGLTEDEMEELTNLHEVAMEPTQEEEDWMLLAMIKAERKQLSIKYLPQLSNYKIEDTCNICHRYFYKKGNLQSHMERVHKEEILYHKVQVVPEDDWLSKSLPNLADYLATIPENILVSKEDELNSKKDYDNIMCELKKVKFQIDINKSPSINCIKCKFNTTTNESLKIHIENVHEPSISKLQSFQNKNSTLKCLECNFNTLSKESLETHIEYNHEPCFIQCGQCLLWMPSGQRLRIHKKLNHSKHNKTSQIKKNP